MQDYGTHSTLSNKKKKKGGGWGGGNTDLSPLNTLERILFLDPCCYASTTGEIEGLELLANFLLVQSIS